MNTSHRADIAMFQKFAVFDQEEMKTVRSRFSEDLVPFFWHDLNEEDLLEDDNLLTLLDSRSRHDPQAFTHFDVEMLRFAASTGITPYRVIADRNGCKLQSYVRTGCFDGINADDQGNQRAAGCAILSGEHLDVLFRQVHLLQFLVMACQFILKEPSSIDSADTVSPALPTRNHSERTCMNDWRRSLEYPYLPPTVDNLDVCSKLVQARLEEAQDALFGLRECPRTFQEYTKMFERYDPEVALNKSGKPFVGVTGLFTRDKFRDKTVTEAVSSIFKEACMWDTLSRRISSVQSHLKGSPESRNAMRELKVFLEHIVLPALRHILRYRFMASPAMKRYVYRVTENTETDGKFDHRLEFRKSKILDLIEDKLIWTLFQLVTTDMGLKGLDSLTMIIELRRLVEDDNVPTMHISSGVDKVIADLALYAELWVQCRSFEPVVFYHESNADRMTDALRRKRAILIQTHLTQELDKLADREDDDNFLSLGSTVHHTLDVLEYPVDIPPNKSRTAIMQNSESALDNFWAGFDKHIKEHCSKHIVEPWERLWPRKESLTRTQDWKDDLAPLVGGLGAVNLEFGHEENMSRSITRQAPKQKSKKTKSKPQASSSENTEDPQPDQADDDHTQPEMLPPKKKSKKKKKKRTPQASSTERTEDPQPYQVDGDRTQSDQADDGRTQPEKLQITVNKRAWDVFQDALFSGSTKEKKPKQIPWTDFVHAMTSLGFNMKTLFGSVRRFEPGEKAKSAGLERSINFHEPHGNDVKLTSYLSRRFGRRLTRVYGIDMSSLVMEK